ncbi:hypothetical protein ACSBR2_018415 [Camellia fascicularis]
MSCRGTNMQISMLCLVFFLTVSSSSASSALKVGYHQTSCPSAEAVVRKAVHKALSRNHSLAANLIRMQFHDCFVRGCDASILLDSTPGNPSEKEIIDEAKSKLESLCPQIVSCFDIIAFAARDSISKVGGTHYSVPLGRRNGRGMSEENQLFQRRSFPEPPFFFFDAKQLQENFARKCLTLEEMVTLSRAHSIGVSHCSFFSNRLDNFSAT